MFPALSIAEAIRQLSPEGNVAFVGRKSGLEASLLPEKGYEYYGVSTGQVRGKGLEVIHSIFQIIRGFFESLKVIRLIEPEIVLGVGGYVSFPVGIAAFLSGKPLYLHEQNAIAGSSNRLLGKMAKRVFTGFEVAGTYFNRAKVVYTGNPLRDGLVKKALAKKEELSKPYSILILGGSGGARSVNSFSVEIVKKVKERGLPFFIYHQTGERDYERMSREYRGLNDSVRYFPFVDEIGDYYEKASFVVSRGGAITLSEISAFCIPAVIIPYPYAADGHQEVNARIFEKSGCGMVMREEELDVDRLLDYFLALAGDVEKYREVMVNARRFAKPFAADEIARACMEINWGRSVV